MRSDNGVIHPSKGGKRSFADFSSDHNPPPLASLSKYSRPLNPPSPTSPNFLLALPTGILLRVCSYLSHKELLLLSQTSQLVRHVVDHPANGLWRCLVINAIDTASHFSIESVKRIGKSRLSCIKDIVLDQTTCKNFKDGKTFANEVRLPLLVFVVSNSNFTEGDMAVSELYEYYKINPGMVWNSG